MLVNCFFALVSALQGVQLSPLGFAACLSKNCTNRVVGLLLGWCTARGCSCLSCTNKTVGYCSVGALETSAPPESTP